MQNKRVACALLTQLFLSCSLAGCGSRECKGPKAKRIGLRAIPEGNWFCPTCAKAEFPKAGCNDNDPVHRTVLMCAIEDHKLRDDPDQPDVKHAYLTHLLNTPALESKLDLAHCDAEVSRRPEHMQRERIRARYHAALFIEVTSRLSPFNWLWTFC